MTDREFDENFIEAIDEAAEETVVADAELEAKTTKTAEAAPECEPVAKAAHAKLQPSADATQNIFFSILRFLLVAILVSAIVLTIFMRNTESNAPAEQVFSAVAASVKTDKMKESTDRYFKKYYGLNAADYEAVLFYAPISNMDAEELLVVKLKDPAQAEALQDAILKRQSDKEQSFEGYAPEQYALAQKYILDVQGNYVLFVIDENGAAIDAAFANSLK